MFAAITQFTFSSRGTLLYNQLAMERLPLVDLIVRKIRKW